MLRIPKVQQRMLLTAVIATCLALPAQAAEIAVDQINMTFVPSSVAIHAGDAVRFTNSDRIAHNITITNPDGTSVDEGMDSYKNGIVITFSKPGVYKVGCRIHPAMKMTVKVN